MSKIREILRREAQWLLWEFGVPNFRMLLYRLALWACFYIIVIAALIGIMLIGHFVGLAAMAAVVFLLFVVALRMEGGGTAGDYWSSDQARLPGGQRLLPRSRSLTPSRPEISRKRIGRKATPD